MNHLQSKSLSRLAFAALALWAVLHVLHFDRFIYHDAWKYGFPMVYRIANSGACMDLPSWLGTVDNGSPVSVYALSMSLTHLLRIPELYLLSCLDLAPRAAVYLHKFQIFCSWALLAFSMYALGRALFVRRASATYLFVATLLSGACLDASHSDQIISELFWVPWCALSMALWHRRIGHEDAPRYFNLGTLFFVISLLDHYPHLVAFGAGVAGIVYFCLYPAGTLGFLRRNWYRLWPSVILLAIVGAQLLYLKGAISDYSPSLRADLVVDPAQFGTTGFVQPTAIVAPFFPLSFLADYDRLFITLPQYVFKLDLLLFCFGSVPLLLFIAAMLGGRSMGRARIGWGIFLLAIVAVSLQQTRLYFLLFHVPFFDLFRGYFLFSMLSVFAFLVISGYGFDALADAKPAQRQALVRKALVWFAASACLAGVLFAWLVHFVPSPLQTARKISVPLLFDLLALGGAAWIAWRYAAASEEKWGRAIVVALVVLQVPFVVGAYRMLAFSSNRMFDGYRLDAADTAPDPGQDTRTGVVRKLCTRYAQCYLSTRRTVSLNLDPEGTFLRNRDEPVFQPGLSRIAQEALAGLSHPDAWLSRQLVQATGKQQIVSALNSERNPAALLEEKTFTRARVEGQLPRAADRKGAILGVSRGADRVSVTYRATEPQILSLAVNMDRGWRASIGDRKLAVVPANFGGVAVSVPAGEANVLLEYRNPRSELFFLSRYLLLVLALYGAFQLLRKAGDR